MNYIGAAVGVSGRSQEAGSKRGDRFLWDGGSF